MTRPCRRITLHFSQIFLTLGCTFTSVESPEVPSATPRAAARNRVPPAGAGRRAFSPVSEDDPAAGEVIGRQLHHHPVLREDPDVVLPHLATDVGEDLVSVLQLNAERCVGQGFDHPPLELDGAVLLGHVLRDPGADRAAGHARATANRPPTRPPEAMTLTACARTTSAFRPGAPIPRSGRSASGRHGTRAQHAPIDQDTRRST